MGNGDSKVFSRRLSWRHGSLNPNLSYAAVSQPFSRKPKNNHKRLQLQGYWIENSVEIPRSQSVSGKLRVSNSMDCLSVCDQQTNALAACQAFKKHRADIMNAGEAAIQFFSTLLSRDVIPEATRTRVLFSGMSKSEKYIAIVDAIEARVIINPAVFQMMVSLLQSDPVMHKSGTKLLDTYREYNVTYANHLKAIALPATVRYGEYLNSYYKALLPPPKYKWPPTASRKPFNLSITNKGMTSLHYLMAPPEDNTERLSCVLLAGDAGVGKSHLTIELCKRWDEIETLRSYCLVLLLRGQEKRVQEAKTIGDLLSYHNSSIQPEVSRELIENEGDGLLLIVDAVDMVPPSSLHKSSTLMQILQGTYLPKSTLLLTCRSSSTTTVLSLCKRKVDRCVELTGFSQDEIEQHAENSLGYDSLLLSDFHDYLSSNPAIRSTMHIPLHTAVVVESFKDAKLLKHEPPRNLTEVYDQLARQLLKYHLLLQGGMDDRFAFPERFEHLPQKVYQQFCSLAKIAYSSLVNQETGSPKLPKGCYHLGFMVAVPELYTRKNAPLLYSYLHPHLQEYLAAFHVMSLSVEEQKDFYTNHFKSPHLQGLWRFVGGMTHLKGALWEEELAKLSKESLLNPTLLQCLFEAHKHVSCDHVFRRKEVTFPQAQYGEDTTPLDCYQLGCCLAPSTCNLKLKVRLDTKMLQHFLLGLKSSSYSATKVETLFLRPPITIDTIATLQELPPLLLTGLDLSHCNLDSSTIDQLARVVPYLVSLTHLDIRGNPIGKGGMVSLFHSLSSLYSFESLNIINTGVRCRDIDALAPLFSKWRALKKLCIGDENLPSECVPTILHTALTNSQLQHLQLWLTDLQPHMSLLAKLLSSKHSSLTRLELHGCKVGERGCQLLAESLYKNRSLKQLVLSMFEVPVTSQLGEQGAVAIANMLRVNRTLESVEIMFDRSLERSGALALVSALEHNVAMRQLKLPQQHFSRMEMSVIDTRVLWSSP